MADIRIKDLTTEAPTSLTGDFLPIDGGTGTRKLSAFNPTFGGNATVGGTLTVSGQANYSNGPLQMSNGREFQFQWGSSTLTLRDNTAGNNPFTANGSTSTFTIGYTTASNNTSSGALVVGDGTSGGLGVGGAITLGSSLTSTASDGKIVISGSGNTTGTKELQFVRADGGDSTVLGLAGSAYAGVLTGLGNNDAYLYTSSAYAFRIFVGTTNRFDFTATQFKINPTTASNSTSSGALVVSGGVGVAGAGYFGGTVTIASNFSIASTGFYAGGRTPGAGRFLYSATAGTMLCTQTGSSYDLSLASATGTVILGNPTGTSNLEAAGSIKTAAPSGGTAAAWKLGTVATVSPTSPNRTIEVDIGGTIYYIAAKTTNN